ncbi:MAG: hypothetical protein IIA62_00820 [Nitrospinae bacterium]|nr:hypothetical protein [Nitrospinota bacterium]
MKKVMVLFVALAFLAIPFTAIAGEGPMTLPEGANAEAVKHNGEGITHWNKGHFDVALKHFAAASKIDSAIGESHFNEAICLDKLGSHGEATMHFKAAKKNANGNAKILNSPILNGHIGG